MFKYILLKAIEMGISICVGLQVLSLLIWAGVSNGWSLAGAMFGLIVSSMFIRF